MALAGVEQVWGPRWGMGAGECRQPEEDREDRVTLVPPPPPPNGHPEGTTGRPSGQSAGLPAHCCLNFNSFTRSKSGPQMHLFKVYTSMARSLFTELGKHHHNLT